MHVKRTMYTLQVKFGETYLSTREMGYDEFMACFIGLTLPFDAEVTQDRIIKKVIKRFKQGEIFKEFEVPT